MHIAVFYQYYHNPDCAATGRHFTFLQEWSKKHEITLITTNAWEQKRITHDFPWVPEGVRLINLPVSYDNTMSTTQRLWAFGKYVLGAFGKGLRIPRPDVIFGTSTPLSAAWIAAKVARLRGIPWVFEVRDLWPDFPIQMGAVPHAWIQRRLYAMEHGLYRRAAHVVALSSDMEAHVRTHDTEAVTTVVNGTDFPMIDQTDVDMVGALRQSQGLVGKQVVLYAGTWGRANDIPTLIATAEKLTDQPHIQMVVAGDGFYRDEVRQAAAQLPNLVALPPQPRVAMLAWMKLADLHIVSFIDRPVLRANSPAKFFDSLGTGTPVIVTNPGWTKTFVETHQCGWYVPPSDPDALARQVRRLLADPDALHQAGAQADQIARTQFDRRVLARQVEAILVQAAQRVGE